MKLVSALITGFNRLTVAVEGTADSSLIAQARVTRSGKIAAVAGTAPHANGRGFDITLAEELSLEETVTVTLGDGQAVTARADYSLFDTPEFDAHYFYGGPLGPDYAREETVFRLWSPLASAVMLHLYARPGSEPFNSVPLSKGAKGVYHTTVEGDLHGICYAYAVTAGGRTALCVDPYAKATTENAKLGVVLNLEATNPAGWSSETHVLPHNPTDAILYEVHVRDFTISPDSGVEHKGKFLGFAEENTVSPQGEQTGLAHLKELGITHVHLMPVMDYATVDEENLAQGGYNWGYDPFSYFVPDGSYSTNPADGGARIEEFKRLVHALHQNGIGVVLDVVYNHTYFTETSPLNLVMPDYFYRKSCGCFTNGSGCGNELASERSMVRKLMIDSLLYWVHEYGIDGFRFDLMGVHDIQTMNYIRHKLDEIDSRILVYGEGWQGGPSVLPGSLAATKGNAEKLSDRIALFNDDYRDALKGSAFEAKEKGYLGGCLNSRLYGGLTEPVKAGLVGATAHPHVMYRPDKPPFAKRPTQTVTYDSCHDNYTLYDKLTLANPELGEPELIRLNKLAAALVLTAQGIPFLHAGEEFLRRKLREDGTPEHNSYRSPDSVNQIVWSRKQEYREVFEYYKGLIRFRRAHKALRMTTAEDTERFLKFLYTAPENRICFRLAADAAGDTVQRIVVIINPTTEAFDCRFTTDTDQPGERYEVYADAERAGDTPLYAVEGDSVRVPPVCALILVKAQ